MEKFVELPFNILLHPYDLFIVVTCQDNLKPQTGHRPFQKQGSYLLFPLCVAPHLQ